MEIKTTQKDGGIFLDLNGRLDAVSAPKLKEALTSILKINSKVELDLSKIVYVSSAGLRVLLFGMKAARSSGKSMSLKNVSADVMEVFEITGFSSVLSFA